MSHYPFLRLGHRGCMGKDLPPENTLAAFDYAHEKGLDGIEFDVQVTKDRQLVVVHDPALMTEEQKTVVIDQLDYAELVALFPNIPTLDQVLVRYLGKFECLNIELKAPGIEKEFVAAYHNYLTQGWRAEQLIVSSFDFDLLKAIHKIDQSVVIAALCGHETAFRTVPTIIEALCFVPSYIHPQACLVDEPMLRDAEAHHIKLNLWQIERAPIGYQVPSTKQIWRLAEGSMLTGVIFDDPSRDLSRS